ncbi:MAG: 50S ribosomal protein L25 [Planctomycetota bacterium]
MQSKHTLEVKRREKTGSRYARRERELGRLPAVLYGHGQNPVSLSLDAKEAVRFFEQGERVFTIELKEEKASQTVLLKDIQFDYLGTNVIHVDLTRVDLTEEVETSVAVNLVGEAKGLKTAGAVMTTPTTSITIRTTVAALPEQIDVRIDDVDAGDTFTAGDITLPDGITLVSDVEDVIARIAIKAEEDLDAESEDVAAESSEPEVITEKKKEEDGE